MYWQIFRPQTLKQSTFLSLFCCESNGRYQFSLLLLLVLMFGYTHPPNNQKLCAKQEFILAHSILFHSIPFQQVIIGCYNQVKFFCYFVYSFVFEFSLCCFSVCPFISFDSRHLVSFASFE